MLERTKEEVFMPIIRLLISGKAVIAGLGLLLCAMMVSNAHADLKIRFIEGAPKDRFTITNSGGCDLGPSVVTIHLSGSASGLIFDVTSEGMGVEVFQPFEMVSGRNLMAAMPTVRDGDSLIELQLLLLPPGDVVSFSIDVDDTAGSREITVSGSEIVGAATALTIGKATLKGVFSADSTSLIKINNCQS